jgi:dTDP-4-dehydrorhamnose 3,5-epimerase-like enzyme
MTLAEKVKQIPRTLLSDDRGWFLKVFTGKEIDQPRRTEDVYLTMANPGQVRGNHYHIRSNEWFTVIQGAALAFLADPTTGETLQWHLDGRTPVTLYVPAGVAHAFQNPKESQTGMLLIACADQPYDPHDTAHYPIVF